MTESTTIDAAATSTSASSRLTSLDGLRGVAAVVVVVHHSLLSVPVLAAPYYTGRAPDPGHWKAWILVSTPAHLVWAGTEAVFVFFVLSGLVLTLPVLKDPGHYRWLVYYPRRLVRLYLPVLVAVAFGTVLALLVSRQHDQGLGAWLQARPASPTWHGVLMDVTLLAGVSRLISPLWSLQWEVAFSLLLPAFVGFAIVGRRAWWLAMGMVIAVCGAGALTGHGYLLFLPMFAAGALLAVRLPELRERGARRSTWQWVAFTIVAALMLSSYWLALGAGLGSSSLALTRALAVAGSAMVVTAGLAWPLAQRFLTWRPVHWVGAVSFSLYLVHEPIVIAAAFLLGPGRGPLVVVVALPLALVVAAAFFRWVEQPSHRLARALGARLSARA